MDINNKNYYIGKENKIIYSDEIPFEITKYLKKAYKYYSEMFKKNRIGKKINDNFIINLRINDEFVKENTIGYIKKEWGWKIKYNNKDKLFIISKIINNEEKEIKVKKNKHIKDIKEYFDGQEKKQKKVEFKINKDYEDYKLIEKLELPNSWRLSHINYIKDNYMYFYYEGPEEEINSMKDYLIELLKEYNIYIII